MPWLKWLMFHMPMSSPQRIRIFGCFVAMVLFLPLFVQCGVAGCRAWPGKMDRSGCKVCPLAKLMSFLGLSRMNCATWFCIKLKKSPFKSACFYVAQLLGGGGFGIRNVHTPPNTIVVPTV